jgi:transposase-like protein
MTWTTWLGNFYIMPTNRRSSMAVTKEERQRIIEALQSGRTVHEVAASFHRSRTTVSGIRLEAGLAGEPPLAVLTRREVADGCREASLARSRREGFYGLPLTLREKTGRH